MKKCYVSWAVFIIIFLGSFLGNFLGMNQTPVLQPEPVAAVAEATGASMQEYSINGWGRLPEGVKEEQLETIVKKTMLEVGGDAKELTMTHNRTPKQDIVRGEVVSEGFHKVVAAEIIYPGKYNKAGSYVVINVESSVWDVGQFVAMRQKVKNIFHNFGSTPMINTCLTGSLDGKLDDVQCQERLNKAFAAANASIVDTVKQDEYYSYTGFSPNIANSLTVGGKQINLNIAMRYSQYEGRTYILVGSPVITKEY